MSTQYSWTAQSIPSGHVPDKQAQADRETSLRERAQLETEIAVIKNEMRHIARRAHEDAGLAEILRVRAWVSAGRAIFADPDAKSPTGFKFSGDLPEGWPEGTDAKSALNSRGFEIEE